MTGRTSWRSSRPPALFNIWDRTGKRVSAPPSLLPPTRRPAPRAGLHAAPPRHLPGEGAHHRSRSGGSRSRDSLPASSLPRATSRPTEFSRRLRKDPHEGAACRMLGSAALTTLSPPPLAPCAGSGARARALREHRRRSSRGMPRHGLISLAVPSPRQPDHERTVLAPPFGGDSCPCESHAGRHLY